MEIIDNEQLPDVVEEAVENADAADTSAAEEALLESTQDTTLDARLAEEFKKFHDTIMSEFDTRYASLEGLATQVKAVFSAMTEEEIRSIFDAAYAESAVNLLADAEVDAAENDVFDIDEVLDVLI